jgi:membrane-bound lytic murein transglycosylase B
MTRRIASAGRTSQATSLGIRALFSTAQNWQTGVMTISMRLITAVIGTAAVALMPASTGIAQTAPAATPADAGFQSYLAGLWPRAQSMGVSRRTFDRVIPTLTFNPRVVQLDRSQLDEVVINPNAPIAPFAPYRARHVDAARIAGGQAVYARERTHLSQIERATGVPPGIVLGIYGHETNYGRITGNFDLLRSLSTLAYEGRRRALFEGEFLAALVMVERGAPREALIGSWAGAFGHPQFLPSVYLRLARDGDGDGVAAIWNNQADALASIAHYLQVAGYRRGERWGYAVSVPGGLNRSSVAQTTASPRCPRVFQRHSRWLTADEWRSRGVSFRGRAPAGDTMLSLLEPDGPGATAYLLTGSYRAILDYNCSNFYALSVGLLADEIAP